VARVYLQSDGTYHDENGNKISSTTVDADDVNVQHLEPYVFRFQMKHSDVGIRVVFSCHCWSETFDSLVHGPNCIIVRDGNKERVFCQNRYNHSPLIHGLIENMSDYKVYITTSERNYGLYNIDLSIGMDSYYTVFFTLKKDKGKYNGKRHSLSLYVESAYYRGLDCKLRGTKALAIVDATLTGKKIPLK